jgi:hypothetical protein
MRIICLHSFWRTSSTYFWQKFRSVPDLVAYYEPFHETLNSQEQELPPRVGSSNWKSGHPAIADYWSEYREMNVNMSQLGQYEYGTFNKQEYFTFSKGKEQQISYLVDRAVMEGRSTVCLCFTRSLGSSTKIRRSLQNKYPNASQLHVLLKRDPRVQVSANVRLFMAGQLPFVPYYILALSDQFTQVEPHIGIDLHALKGKSFPAAAGLLRSSLHKALSDNKQAAVFNVAIKSYLACTMLQLQNESNHFDLLVDVGELSSVNEYRESLSSIAGIQIATDDYLPSQGKVIITKDEFSKGVKLMGRALEGLGLPINSSVALDYYRDYLP